MGVVTRSQGASDREKWDIIFNGLVKMLQSQQEQLQTLVKERKILEDRLRIQMERWKFDICLYEDHIFKLKHKLEGKQMESLLEEAKGDFMVGMKQKEASISKLRLEEAEDLLSDFRVWLDFLTDNSKDVSQRNPTKTSKRLAGGKDSSSISGSSRNFKGEVRRLELESPISASEKNSQISALLSENKFAWNQYNLLESELTNKLHCKNAELEEANKKIEALISGMEELKSSNSEKDQIIERLKGEVSQKEADLNRLKFKTDSVTPVLRPCKAEGSRDQRNTVKKIPSADQVHDSPKDTNKGSQGSKRKVHEVIPISETPSFFTSTFKVPKLKTSRLR
ncbi:hypothetical protein SLE2022_098640 [Rubroshorea leprosula]